MTVKQYVTIDRFEGALAVLEDEDGGTRAVPREALPANAAESDVLFEENGVFTPDPAETERRREAARQLMARLRRG